MLLSERTTLKYGGISYSMVPSGNTETIIECEEAYWRPKPTCPQLPAKPTIDTRLKRRPESPRRPLATLKPPSSWNTAFKPLPRSSLPRRPQREGELPPEL